jgi:hypothetical protein
MLVTVTDLRFTGRTPQEQSPLTAPGKCSWRKRLSLVLFPAVAVTEEVASAEPNRHLGHLALCRRFGD